MMHTFSFSLQIIERINKWTCSACPVSNLMAGAIKWHVFTKDICGSYKIPLQRTMTNEIIVNFVSDGRLSYRGFKLYFAHMESEYNAICISYSNWI